MKDDPFIYGMRAAVNALNFIPFYVINYELIEYMPQMEKYLYKLLFNGIMVMTLCSYWMASLMKPQKIPQITIDEDTKLCNSCNNWKPERTHHCKICGTCVPNMDHHCPWIGNCVGHHNYKPFFLFCFYQMCLGFVFFSAGLDRAFHSPRHTPELSLLGVFCFWFTNLIDLPICFALIGLSGSLFCDMFSNMSTLEGMGKERRRYPCYGVYNDPYFTKDEQVPNKYDLLWVNNLTAVLGPRMYYWLIPFYMPQTNSLVYPKIPEIEDTKSLFKNEEGVIIRRPKEPKACPFESKIADYVRKAG